MHKPGLQAANIAKVGAQGARVFRAIPATVLLITSVMSGTRSDSQELLTPSKAIEAAIKNGPQSRSAKFAWEGAVALAEHDRPVLHPTLSAAISNTVQGPRVTYPVTGAYNSVVLPEEASRFDLVFEMPLYRAGLGAARQRHAAQLQLVNLDYRKALGDVAYGVQKLFLDLERSRSGIRSARQGLTSAEEYVHLVQSLISTGSGKPIDLSVATAEMAAAKGSLEKAEAGERLALMAINQSLGRPLSSTLSVDYVSMEPQIPESPDPAIAVADSQRIEIAALRISLNMARAGATLARAQAQPGISARGQVTEQTPAAFLHEHYAAATIELQLPILDGGKSRLDTMEAVAKCKQIEALIEQTRSGITLDVIRAWNKLKQANADLQLARLQLDSAQRAVIVADTAYRVGRSSVSEASVAHRELVLARERQAQASTDLLAAALEYNQAQGVVPPIVNSLAALPGIALSESK